MLRTPPCPWGKWGKVAWGNATKGGVIVKVRVSVRVSVTVNEIVTVPVPVMSVCPTGRGGGGEGESSENLHGKFIDFWKKAW